MDIEEFANRVDHHSSAVSSLDEKVAALSKWYDSLQASFTNGVNLVSGEETRVIGSSITSFTADAGIDLKKVFDTRAFKDWLVTIAKEKRFEVKKVHIQNVDMFGPKVGFIKFVSSVKVDNKNPPGIVFMRGGAVGVLVVLSHKDADGNTQLHTLVVRQPRVAVAVHDLVEIPAGMLDGDGNFAGVAAKEMKEETGIEISERDLFDMTQAVKSSRDYPGMYPTCGGSDEFNRLFLYRRDVTSEELEDMNGRLTGVPEEGEMIKVQILPLDKLWRHTADAKALAALCLYKKLTDAGKVPACSER